MIHEFKKKYRTLGDARIDKIDYITTTASKNTVIIYMNSFNWEEESWEDIVLKFDNVTTFRLIETPKIKNSVIFEALILEAEGGIIFDFFPTQVDGLEKLLQDPNSSFKVNSESFTYKAVENDSI